MIQSIRRFLFISLFITITVASSITAIGNYLLDEKIIRPYLDEQLVKISTVVDKLNQLSNTDAHSKQNIENYFKSIPLPNFIFQVWDANDKLTFHSNNGKSISFKNTPEGFSDIVIDDQEWRVYSKWNKINKTKIIVAELCETRNRLVDLMTRNNGYILLVTFPIFALLTWLIVGLALRSLTRVTSEISNRASNYLEPVSTHNLPIEIKPLVIELNDLFKRLKHAFDRNKRFAADAAHELRTPLAALKTQVQVAIKADNEADKTDALQKVVQCVDRSSHVVTQLLTLSQLTQENLVNDWSHFNLHYLTQEVLTYLVPIALEKEIDIELSKAPTNSMIYGNETILGILIRNIVDNAIRYTPVKGTIKVDILNQNNEVILRVSDTGPGIPIELRERVFERFYRILGTQSSGSGLGLAIVNQIAELHHARVTLKSPTNGIGLQFDVSFPITQELHHGNI